MRRLTEYLPRSEDTRLMGVVLMPLWRELRDAFGAVAMHTVHGSNDAGGTAGPAVARLLPSALAVIHGNDGDGGEWFAVFHHVDSSDEMVEPEDVDRPFVRALDLVGVGTERIYGASFTHHDLELHYPEHDLGTVSSWSSMDLLQGLIINLTVGDLSVVVENATDESVPQESRAARRRELLDEALRAWATVHSGPEAVGE